MQKKMRGEDSESPGSPVNFAIKKFESIRKSNVDISTQFQISVVRQKRQRFEFNGGRNFSVGMAARFLQVFGNSQPKQHNKQLVALKSKAQGNSGVNNVRRLEELQEWMEHLEFRLSSVCQVSPGQHSPSDGRPLSTMPALSSISLPGILSSATPASTSTFPSPLPPAPASVAAGPVEVVNPTTQASPSSLSGSSASGSVSSSGARHQHIAQRPTSLSLFTESSRDDRNPSIGKVGRSKTAFSSTRLGRSRSEEKLIESVAAAVTDSRYLEELQLNQQKESISSLHERLAERKVKEEEPKPPIAVRPKSAAVPKKQQLARKKKKSTSNEKSTNSSDESKSVHLSPRRSSALSSYSLKESAISRRWSVRSRCEHYLEQQWQHIQPGEHDTPP